MFFFEEVNAEVLVCISFFFENEVCISYVHVYFFFFLVDNRISYMYMLEVRESWRWRSIYCTKRTMVRFS